MIYLKTLNLHDWPVQKAILSGQIKLQRGQWCICGANNDKRCRYVQHSKYAIHVVHWQGDSKTTNDKFISACEFQFNRSNTL